MTMRTKVEVFKNRVYFNVSTGHGGGVSFGLSWKRAVDFADKLNAALDEPNEQESQRILKDVDIALKRRPASLASRRPTKLERWSDRRSKKGL